MAHGRSVLEVSLNIAARSDASNDVFVFQVLRMLSIRRLLIAAILSFFATTANAQVAQSGRSVIDDVLKGLDAKRDVYAGVAQQIWGFAEVGYQEQKSSALLQSQLRTAGFTIKNGVADIPTAFIASWGSGKPVIGIVGEFDALPGLSQEAIPTRKPVVEGAPGHGCGHHLFGTASTAAAIAVKEWLETNHRTGTLRFYGTPAEEGGFTGVVIGGVGGDGAGVGVTCLTASAAACWRASSASLL